jgi:hypothetical protein
MVCARFGNRGFSPSLIQTFPVLPVLSSMAQKSGIHCRPPSFTVSGSSELRLLELRGLVPSLTFTAGGELRPALKEFIVGYDYPPTSLTVSNLRNVSAATLARGLPQRLRYRNTARSSRVIRP